MNELSPHKASGHLVRRSPAVLVVDDEADLRELLALTLVRLGLDVDTAESVERARSLLSAHGVTNVEVVTADAAADGFKACGTQPVNVIVLSGSVAEVPDALLNRLTVGGRLVAIVGQEPIMRARLITRTAEAGFSTEEPWDFVAPRLLNFPEPSAFRF